MKRKDAKYHTMKLQILIHFMQKYANIHISKTQYVEKS